MLRLTRYPIQTLSVSTDPPVQTTMAVLELNWVKKARTRWGLRGGGIWAADGPGKIPERSMRPRAASEPLADKGINDPFVRKSAPASGILRLANWGGRAMFQPVGKARLARPGAHLPAQVHAGESRGPTRVVSRLNLNRPNPRKFQKSLDTAGVQRVYSIK